MKNLNKLAATIGLVLISSVAFASVHHENYFVSYTINNYTNQNVQAFDYPTDHASGSNMVRLTADAHQSKTIKVRLFRVNDSYVTRSFHSCSFIGVLSHNTLLNYSLVGLTGIESLAGYVNKHLDENSTPNYYNVIAGSSDQANCRQNLARNIPQYATLATLPGSAPQDWVSTLNILQGEGPSTNDAGIIGPSNFPPALSPGQRNYFVISTATMGVNVDTYTYSASVYCVNPTGKGLSCPFPS